MPRTNKLSRMWTGRAFFKGLSARNSKAVFVWCESSWRRISWEREKWRESRIGARCEKQKAIFDANLQKEEAISAKDKLKIFKEQVIDKEWETREEANKYEAAKKVNTWMID
jgi:hypothetical protein